MATHRHHRAGFVVATAAALVVGGSLPAQASTRPLGGISSHTLQVAQHRIEARRAGQAAEAARQRTTARIGAVHAATTQGTSPSAADAPVIAPVSSETVATAAPDATPAAADTAATAPTAAAVAPSAPAAPAPVAPVVATTPSGEAAPVGDLPGWKQTYVEDFAKAAPTGSFVSTYGARWGAYDDGWKDTSKNGTYMPSKVLSVHDGVLDYSIRSENGQHLVSAPFVKQTFGQVYGRYSVRFRSDALAGYKTAWLLWPDSERWPDDGEIDFPEGNLDGTIEGFAHNASSAGGQVEVPTNATYAQWHTATIEWTPGKVSFALDGKVMGGSTKNVPATAMHWVLQTETALDGGAPAAGVAGHVLVDWVALYTRA
ncbi:MAG: glycoside hydrolase [Frankiales bacterium]|nr:glycoside hydrolase [Frankiales bacterium]